MKNIYLTIVFTALILACSQKNETTEQDTEADVTTVLHAPINFEWLLAEWIRVDDVAGNKTYENWSKINDSTYSGYGYTLAEADTVFEEQMLLHLSAAQWQLEVIGPGDGKTTVFTMTQQTNNSFTVENLAHDFPTKIKYFLESDTLKAAVSNSERLIHFNFIKR